MARGFELETSWAASDQSLFDKVGPHATKIMIGAAVVGLIAAFLPAVTVELSFLGKSATESLAVWRDWRGKLDMLAYIGVGVMAAMMLRKSDAAVMKKLAIACLIGAGVAVLASVWLPVSISSGNNLPKEFGSISIGIGCYLNILTSLALAASAAIQAKRAGVFA